MLAVDWGVFYKPDLPRLQADGEVIIKAIHKYKETHGRVPKDEDEFLADESVPMEAKNLLNSGWSYMGGHRFPGAFSVYKDTGHMGDKLMYSMVEDGNENRQFRWTIGNRP